MEEQSISSPPQTPVSVQRIRPKWKITLITTLIIFVVAYGIFFGISFYEGFFAPHDSRLRLPIIPTDVQTINSTTNPK